ncbi:lipopolysaccharide biosynthesis protein [Macrococcus armenti]|uniref:lipopolysaccharide biosynthesis protein n=1 Tax=Macrococcus armenti TaxID=2875764 RepID=UPI001CCB98A7|nr:oligosaccharide flippase family protein [Macrococcus armenti]UBH13867.1 oligosaccharide flippase family protein [Macrococcus armenti]
MKNLFWTITANLIQAITKWGYLILIARILTKADVGEYGLGLALTAPIVLFFNFRLRTLLVTSFDGNFNIFKTLRNILDILSIIFIAVIALLIYKPYFILIILIGLIKILDLKSELYYSLPHYFNNLVVPAKLIIYKSILLSLVFICTMLISKDLTITLFIQATIQLIFLVYESKICLNFIDEEKTSFNNEPVIFKTLITSGIVLGFVQLIVSLNSNIPRLFIENILDVSKLADYSILAYIFTIGNVFISAVVNNILPRLRVLKINGNLDVLKRLIFLKIPSLVLTISLIVVPVVYMLGIELISFIYGKEYYNENNKLVLTVLFIALLINGYSAIIDNTLIVFELMNKQIYISIIVLAVTLILSYYLINKYDLIGASLTIIIVNLLQLLLRIGYLTIGLKGGIKN